MAPVAQVLTDTRLQMLSLPMLPDILQASHEAGCIASFAHVAAACGVRRLGVKHLELHLDWSLLDARTCSADSAVARARRALAAQLLPQPRQLPRPQAGPLPWRAALAYQAGSSVSMPPEVASCLPDAALPAVQARTSPCGRGSQPGAASRGCHAEQACTAAPELVDAAPVAAPRPYGAVGVFAGRKRRRPACEQPGAGAEAAFLASLAGVPTSAVAQARAAASGARAASSSGDSLLHEPQAQPPQLEHMELELPGLHVALLQALQADHSTAAVAARHMYPVAAASSLLDTHALAPDLEAVASAAQAPQARRDALRALACMAVLRQAASFLMHHGITCAHLHLQQALREAPAMAPRCSRAAAALGRALAEVEAGRHEDHPKQMALRRVLLGAQAMSVVRFFVDAQAARSSAVLHATEWTAKAPCRSSLV